MKCQEDIQYACNNHKRQKIGYLKLWVENGDPDRLVYHN